jgi:hypothetical protein
MEDQNLDIAMIKLEKAISCLLHIEKQNRESMLTHLLCKVLSVREGGKQDCEDIMCAVERYMNNFFLYARISVNLEGSCQL